MISDSSSEVFTEISGIVDESEDADRKSKGRDIGYALAANSCEGVYSVESCTITALDVISAFAVPDPGYILAQ